MTPAAPRTISAIDADLATGRTAPSDHRAHPAGAHDILRGLAILGMIVVHWHQRIGLEVGGWGDWIGWAVWMLVEQKNWGIFALLFGVGFAVFLQRLEARDDPVVPIYLRRLAALAGFGVLAEAGFGFNILFEYACWGLVLLAVRQWATGPLLGLAVLAACARPLVAWLTDAAPWVADASLHQAVAGAAQGSDYLALVSARWVLFLARVPDTWPELLPNVNLTLFVLGLVAVRHGVVHQPKRHVRLIVAWMCCGALSWAAWWLWLRHLDHGPGTAALASGLGLAREQWLCFTYTGAVVLSLAYRPGWRASLAVFGDAGRMGLTNYLLQVAVVDVLASGYGFGLRVGPATYVPAAMLHFLVQALMSRAWLRRYRMGPLEWMWRMVTYWRVQPLPPAP